MKARLEQGPEGSPNFCFGLYDVATGESLDSSRPIGTMHPLRQGSVGKPVNVGQPMARSIARIIPSPRCCRLPLISWRKRLVTSSR